MDEFVLDEVADEDPDHPDGEVESGGELVEDELVHVTRPVPPAELPDVSILREVINGLRAL